MPFRRSYISYLFSAVRRDGFGFLYSAFSKYVLVFVGYKFRKPLTGPMSGTISLTYACNLKCVMCDLPARHKVYEKDPGRKKLSVSDYIELIRQFKKIKTTSIAFTGGEPLMYRDFFALVKEVSKCKMTSQVTTNGWYVRGKIDDIFKSGLDSISLSLDGATRETHDSIRGVSGSYARVVDALELLIEERKKRGSQLKVSISATFSEKNHFEAQALVKMADQIGVDFIGFMPVNYIAPSLKDQRPQMSSSERRQIKDTIAWLITERKKNPRIETSDSYFKMFEACIEGGKMPVPCLASYTTFMVDAYGDYFPCHSFYQMEKPWGNFFKSNLLSYWGSNGANNRREEIRGCRECFWNCQVETNLLYAPSISS